MIQWLHRISVGLATGLLALSLALGGLWIGALCGLLSGILWLSVGARRRRWPASAGLILCTALAALGLAKGLAAAAMLVSLVAALTAWDLDDFCRTLEDEAYVQRAPLLQRQHLQRLLAVDLLSLALGLVALQIRTSLTLGVALLLGLLAILGLNRAISYLRRESD